MNPTQIFEATPEDAEIFMNIQSETWLDSYVNSEVGITRADIEAQIKKWNSEGSGRIAEVIKDPTSKTWVAKSDNKIVGFIGVKKTETQHSLEALHILPSYQGHGTGAQLLKTALNWLGDSLPVTLEVVSYNKRAQGFYKHFGFILTDQVSTDPIILPNKKVINKLLMIKQP